MPAAKIVPHLWFDKEAGEAARFYTASFPGSRITHRKVLPGTPSGDAEVVAFELAGHPFMAISAGPYFKINPSISFIVNFDPGRDPSASKNLDSLWKKLSPGAKVRMPLDAYPFSKRFGWIEDRFGVSWQLLLSNPGGEERPFITPSLMFVGANAGKAEEATAFYLSVFQPSRRGALTRWPAGMAPERKGTLMFTDVRLAGVWLAAMDSAQNHDFQFNEGVSLMVRCKDQKEIDGYWRRLSAVPAAEQCGWLKDKYGVSWQIVPEEMDLMMATGTDAQIKALTKAFLPMKKLEIAPLRKAFEAATEAATKKPDEPTKPKPRRSRASP